MAGMYTYLFQAIYIRLHKVLPYIVSRYPASIKTGSIHVFFFKLLYCKLKLNRKGSAIVSALLLQVLERLDQPITSPSMTGSKAEGNPGLVVAETNGRLYIFAFHK